MVKIDFSRQEALMLADELVQSIGINLALIASLREALMREPRVYELLADTLDQKEAKMKNWLADAKARKQRLEGV